MPIFTEPEDPSHPEPTSIQTGIHIEEKEDVKPQTLPITEPHLPVHHSGEHYPVIVLKTEDAALGAHVPVVIPEERPPMKSQTVASADLSAHIAEQSYDQETAEERVTGQEIEEQEQGVLHAPKETETAVMYEPGSVDEQTHEQAQRENAEVPLSNQQRFAPEESENLPAQDSSVPWMQEPASADDQEPDAFYTPEEQDVPPSNAYVEQYQEESGGMSADFREAAPADIQEPDAFYTPEEQDIPQSNAYAEEYQEGGEVLVSSDSCEPWVMVDYPSAPEQENYLPPQEDMRALQHVPVEMPNERFTAEVPEEAEQEYHNEDEGVDMDEAEEEPVPEVCNSGFIIKVYYHSLLHPACRF